MLNLKAAYGSFVQGFRDAARALKEFSMVKLTVGKGTKLYYNKGTPKEPIWEELTPGVSVKAGTPLYTDPVSPPEDKPYRKPAKVPSGTKGARNIWCRYGRIRRGRLKASRKRYGMGKFGR